MKAPVPTATAAASTAVVLPDILSATELDVGSLDPLVACALVGTVAATQVLVALVSAARDVLVAALRRGDDAEDG